MSGIAEVLNNLGYEVSGSDARTSVTTRRLEDLGVRVHVGHASEQVEGAHVVASGDRARGEGDLVVDVEDRGIGPSILENAARNKYRCETRLLGVVNPIWDVVAPRGVQGLAASTLRAHCAWR